MKKIKEEKLREKIEKESEAAEYLGTPIRFGMSRAEIRRIIAATKAKRKLN